jgi:CheY-like chemotaxis protein
LKRYTILIVDDDPDDRAMMEEAFTAQGSTEHLVLSGAQEVLHYLSGIHSNHLLPRMIITDLNMPLISGFELLQTLKGVERYQQMAVLVYSTSRLQKHVDLCLSLGAKEYIIKPERFSDYAALANRLGRIALAKEDF